MTPGQTSEESAPAGRSMWQPPTPTQPAAKIQGHPGWLILASPVPAQKHSSPGQSWDTEQLEPHRPPAGLLRFSWPHIAHAIWTSVTPALGHHPPPVFLRLTVQHLKSPLAPEETPFLSPHPRIVRNPVKPEKSLYISPRVTKLRPRSSLSSAGMKTAESSLREALRQQ